MSVCAVLVNHHGAEEIAAAAAHVLQDDARTEVIVVDNSDDAREWERLEQCLPAPVRRVRAPANLGFGQGCNLALSHTRAERVMLVNPDVRVLPGCTAALAKALQDDPQLAAVAPRQFLDDGLQWRLPPATLPTALHQWATERALRDARSERRIQRAVHAESLRCWTATQVLRQRALSGGILMIRRGALPPGTPLFDPRFFMYYEDSDLCLRLRRSGRALALVPQAKAVHAWVNRPDKAALMEAGARQYFEIHAGPGNPWWPRAQALMARPATIALDRLERFPGEGLAVDARWAPEGWLMELSPSPLMLPAIGRLGHDERIAAPTEVLRHFMGVPVYGRLTPLGRERAFEQARGFLWPGH